MRSATAAALAAALALLPAAARAGADDAEVAASYVLSSTQGTIKLKKGDRGAAKVSVAPKPGAHVSPDAPISVTLAGGPALDLPKMKLTRADSRPFADQGVELELPFSAKAAGSDELKASFTFYICLRDVCARQQKTLSFPVTIE
jgi:hypothetical protein